jgi:hypothetical protein
MRSQSARSAGVINLDLRHFDRLWDARKIGMCTVMEISIIRDKFADSDEFRRKSDELLRDYPAFSGENSA